ncbi:MAG: DNA alkylation repair protein [Alistipes sp.]|nr:DNA alkylation repair protein [Alistipes sp.]
MDNTSRMVALLAELRRERNGLAADTMRFYGTPYGMNYGVAIHTVREKIAGMSRDRAFAEYLYLQDVRELRIAALWLADPNGLSSSDFDFWAAGIINSEVAEQAAMAFLSQADCIDELLDGWCAADNVLLCYAAMLAAARNAKCSADTAVASVAKSLAAFPDSRLMAQGAVALLVAVAERSEEGRRQVENMMSSLPEDAPAARYLREELSWRLEP